MPGQERMDSAEININVSTQVATGGGFLAGGGKINDELSGRDVVIKIQPLDTALAERIIYARDDGFGVSSSILLDYISKGDTITFDGVPHEAYSSKAVSVFDPEQIRKVNH